MAGPHPLVRKFARRDALASQLRKVDEELDAAVRAYSFERGYCVTLRRESVRQEIGA